MAIFGRLTTIFTSDSRSGGKSKLAGRKQVKF